MNGVQRAVDMLVARLREDYVAVPHAFFDRVERRR